MNSNGRQYQENTLIQTLSSVSESHSKKQTAEATRVVVCNPLFPEIWTQAEGLAGVQPYGTQ